MSIPASVSPSDEAAKRALVSVDWLGAHYTHQDQVIVEVSLRSPISWSVKVANGAIQKAIHVDLDSLFCDLNSSLPHVMPPPDQLCRAVRDLGIRNVGFVVI